MKTIDARGKPCPEPVVLTKAQTDRGEKELEVLLDDPVSAANVTRFLESRSFAVQLTDDDGLLTVSARLKEGAPASPTPGAPVPEAPGAGTVPAGAPGTRTFSVLITCATLGRNDPELGEVLMKSFLGTLAQTDAPAAVALMNEGVKLAIYDSSSCDHLKNLEKKGVRVLICGTCVNHFQLADRIGAGSISNMFEILESLNKADKILTL
ncbi:MAG: sulfurtransferase-like selenium metabolism protein YedF [Synergistaceae bacterium]|jgi:selenium metabolism protein YedF|nr:sulfurtransferase-like selenium metabolism protein YedF [Synergistaceae bacterium]